MFLLLHIRCGHCRTLAPELEKAAQKLKKNDPPIPVGKVNAVKETKLEEEYVKGYPTMIVFHKGKPYKYKGEREHTG